ncbi:MAG: iron ABC transporter permease [Actinomycetota bacterium]|nr:iron ABC transporter permease [Actinomycetota bacterium]
MYPPFVLFLTAVLVFSGLVALSIGAVSIPLAEVWRIVLRHLTPGGEKSAAVQDRIIWTFRAPRVVLAMVAGTGLSVAGTALQALVRNPLADSYILGVNQGASLGAVAVLTLGSSRLGGVGVSTAAFVGAAVALALVFLLGQRGGRSNPTRLILAGVAIGQLLSAATSYLEIHASTQALSGVVFWLLGSFASAKWSLLPIPAGVVLATTGWLILQRRGLNALLMGDESASALGVDLYRFRVKLLIACALISGTVVSVVGSIGFVGLMIPHVARLLVGADHRRVLPVAALLGASYLVWVDLAARTLERPAELPIGIFTALLGAPFFLWLMRRRDRQGAVA